jgi:Ricin-type beta-trefoil lectin domain
MQQQRHTLRIILGALALGLSAASMGCADDDTVVVREPPRLEGARVQGLVGAGMMIHSATNPGLCFDAAGDRAERHTPVRLGGCSGRENQRWSFGPATRGSVTITGIAGMCLDIHGERSVNGAAAQLYTCNGGGNQQYAFLSDGRLRELSTGKCLTAAGIGDGAPILVEPCDARAQEQVWSIADR